MSSKKIKPFAIVPKDLYVVRQADVQLKQIIEDMGRPGYVLVSRQMGKTNLLLNAKRELDQQGNCFSYLDVSNNFSDLRSFFRNIIDTTVLSNEELVTSLLAQISVSRNVTINLQPHKEHELELKAILDSLSGKLIICLDEIDALTNVDYSDNVFSLIRSIYFSGRTNYPVFKRLTYVLSGVADPSELIKNKAISPFNIGEKIYLDDFTFEETKQFLSQCDLDLPEDVVERIFYWTSGNPRVTWDLCSAAESVLEEISTLDSDSIDRLVSSLYLKSYDLPPFDHIRTRVQSDKELRNSVMAMHYGKSSTLSDKVKDRLYLAGISTPKQEADEIFFKNRIMSESLSEKWISDIESELLSIDERAHEKVKLHRYEEAIALFKESMLQANSAEGKLASKLNVGFCFVQMSDIASAIAEYEGCVTEGVGDLELINAKHHWLGICYMFSNRFLEAAEHFNKILSSTVDGKKNLFYAEACINLASIWLAENHANEQGVTEADPDIEDLLNRGLKYLASHPPSKIGAENEILYTAYYQLSRYYQIIGQSDRGKHYLDLSLESSDSEVRSTLLYERATYETEVSVQASYYVKCANNIIDSRISLSGGTVMNQLRFGARECIALIGRLVAVNSYKEAKSFVEYIISVEDKQELSAAEMVVSCVSDAVREGVYSIIPNLARLAMLCSKMPKESMRQIVTLGILISEGENVSKTDLFDKYIGEYIAPEDSLLLNTDFRLVHDIFRVLFVEGETDRCIALLDAAEASFERTVISGSLPDETIKSGSMILLLLRFKLYTQTPRELELSTKLMQYVPNIRDVSEFSLIHFPEDFSQVIDHSFRAMIDEEFYEDSVSGGMFPFLEKKAAADSIGRNQIVTVRYLNGTTKQGKFKKFAGDIAASRCSLVLNR
ncbi:AAA-like domain-containing protein [Pseudomonas sp. NPDC089534]|uniref:AAA-like domain-containing protein n=1 Tax=Pseudomonas sp. NPDC089534 TaxID=3364468 RepID=UPI0037F754BC